MTDPAEFSTWMAGMQPALNAWGKYIVGTVTELVKLEVGDEAFKTFFKITPGHRNKDNASALKKLADKKYADAKEQMTDLVGARFVVLLKTDIEVVERVVVAHSAWSRSRDRNPIDEQARRPTSFEYQSVHYLLRNNEEFEHDGVRIPQDTCCEVQIRTLLQHAYAELGHDRIYKGKVVPLSVHRLVARCMALMETTDEMFCAAVAELEQVNRQREQWCAFLDSTMRPLMGAATPTSDDADALEIIDVYKPLLSEAGLDAVRSELNAFVTAKIQQRAGDGGLFAKPVVLLVYWLVKNFPFEVGPMWPVPGLEKGLNQVKADLGIS